MIMSNGKLCIRDELPDIAGREGEVFEATHRKGPIFLNCTNISIGALKSAFGIALHMHQPMVLQNGDITQAEVISNLKQMFDHMEEGDNHNAPVFAWCYSRTADFVRELVDHGKNPRVMLDYSGNLLWGLVKMGRGDILENLWSVTCDAKYQPYVEWLGSMWSHAVVPSTPVPDIALHIRAWQHHFASIFGLDALSRIKGFSPPEMALPNAPDMAYAYVKALLTAGYKWIMVQEHSVENLDGTSISSPHVPHNLAARNSEGETVSIAALIKTQGSDTKLVAQMQPYYEACSNGRLEMAGQTIPPYVLQIGDGENGGVMMNEFPEAFRGTMMKFGTEGTVALNGTEYLELIGAAGLSPDHYIPIQPVGQKRIWDRFKGCDRKDLDRIIAEIKKEDSDFHMGGGSWTNDRSWVADYDNVLDPINKVSALFHEKIDNSGVNTNEYRYRNALTYLLLTQTSCYRYWGQGKYTDYAKELCRRTEAILTHDF